MDILQHNLTAYNKVKNSFLVDNRCCVIHPTGTGKSYVAMQLIRDNKDKNILYVTSYAANLMHFQESVEENLGDMPNLYYSLYAGLSSSLLPSLDFIIFDEFHRAGATEWQKYVLQILEDNPLAKILGLSATPIRYLDNERNMSDELFDGHIASEITLHDALLRGLVPMPNYITCVYSFESDIRKAEERLDAVHVHQDDSHASDLLEKAKRLLEHAEGLDAVFKDKLKKPHGKYIVFCRSREHMTKMIDESRSWFEWMDEEPHYFELYSEEGTNKPYLDFLTDETECLRLLFCINMLNEGVHVKDIDGVILLRPTESLNVYFQQIGRALAVGTTESPQIFDIVNNASTLEPVASFWNGIINDFKTEGKDFNSNFEVWSRDVEIVKLLNEFYSFVRRTIPWDEVYQLCKQYFETYGNLDIPHGYISQGVNLSTWLTKQRCRRKGTIPGSITDAQICMLDDIGMDWNLVTPDEKWDYWYDRAVEFREEHGNLDVPRDYYGKNRDLYSWLYDQRCRYQGTVSKNITEEHIKKLNALGIDWEHPRRWDESYDIALEYYKQHGNLRMTYQYHTEDGYALGKWVSHQRRAAELGKLTEEQKSRLDQIGMVWDLGINSWDSNYAIAKQYFEEFGTLDVTVNTVYNDFALGQWISHMRRRKKNGTLSEEHTRKLDSIGIVWFKGNPSYEQCFSHAKAYYEKHGDLNVPGSYVCPDGFNLRRWLDKQRWKKTLKDSRRLSNEKVSALEAIGMKWSYEKKSWDESYEMVAQYYSENGVLPKYGTCVDGYDISRWVNEQRTILKGGRSNRMKSELSQEKIDKLAKIGIIVPSKERKIS